MRSSVNGGIGQGVTLRDQPGQGLKTFTSSLGLVIRCLAPSIRVTRLSSILACRQGTTAIRQRFIDMNDEPWRIDSGAGLTLDDDSSAEIDLSYYFSKNLAIELAIPTGSTSHDTTIRGSGNAEIDNIGESPLKFRTYTVMTQWHFMPDL